jgi:hypothetical protein
MRRVTVLTMPLWSVGFVKVRVERVLLGGLMSAVAFLLDRRLRKLQR